MLSEIQHATRRIFGQTYRKQLGVYHHKIGHDQYHRKAGVIPVQVKERLRAVAINNDIRKTMTNPNSESYSSRKSRANC
jgi:hypothetical protein